MVNFDSYVDMMQQYRRALCVIFCSKPNPVSVRDGSLKLLVTVYLMFTMLTFVIDFFGVWNSLHNIPHCFRRLFACVTENPFVIRLYRCSDIDISVNNSMTFPNVSINISRNM